MSETEPQNPSEGAVVSDEQIKTLKTKAEANAQDSRLRERYGYDQRQLIDIGHRKANKENKKRDQEKRQSPLDMS